MRNSGMFAPGPKGTKSGPINQHKKMALGANVTPGPRKPMNKGFA